MNAGDSNEITRNYYDRILLKTRYLDSDLPDMGIELWGKSFATPIATAALSHLNNPYQNGMDAFKALALGADAVCVGRELMEPLKEKGPIGVRNRIEDITTELQTVMARTGYHKVSEIDNSCLVFY